MADLINNYTHHTITQDGIITNSKTSNVKKQWIGANGYYHVDIHEFNVATKIAVHRLLALQYIPNPENKRTVNHKDGNKLNNSLNNLEWATDSENVQHAYDTGLQPDTRHHTDDFYETLLVRFFNGESITAISKDPSVNNTLTQTSINLRRTAERLHQLSQFEEELKKQKLQRAKSTGASSRQQRNIQMIDIGTNQVLQIFNNLSEAREYLQVKSCGPMSNVLAGRQNSAYGYFWKCF